MRIGVACLLFLPIALASACSSATTAEQIADAGGDGTLDHAFDPDAGLPDSGPSVQDAAPDAPLIADGGTTSAGTIVPLYAYPTDPSWKAIASAARAHPTVGVVAIVNPDNGVGASKDMTFVSAIGTLQAAGIQAIGYIATNYAKRDAAAVKSEIDAYKVWYPSVRGIFFDEMSNKVGDDAYYRTLTGYAKNAGFSTTVGNPGTDVPESMIGAVDTLFIYESAGLPSVGSLRGWHQNYAKTNFGIIPYGVPSLDPTFVANARASVRYIYVTSDSVPDPWDTLPPYFDALLTALE